MQPQSTSTDAVASDNAVDGAVTSSSIDNLKNGVRDAPACSGCASVHITRQTPSRPVSGFPHARGRATDEGKAPPTTKNRLRDTPASPHADAAVKTSSISAAPSSPDQTVTHESACLVRIRKWYHRLLHLRANPSSLEYSYLILSKPDAVHYHPYDLTIVSHNQIDRQFYYTMSADGVTHVNGDESTHMTLDEFERGCVLNHNTRTCICFCHHSSCWCPTS